MVSLGLDLGKIGLFGEKSLLPMYCNYDTLAASKNQMQILKSEELKLWVQVQVQVKIPYFGTTDIFREDLKKNCLQADIILSKSLSPVFVAIIMKI